MEWWQAYLFWRLDVIGGFFIAFAILFSAGFVATMICRTFGWANGYSYDNEKPENKKRLYRIQNRLFLLCVPMSIFCLIGAASIPTTETAIKIVVTKYGADAITSDTMKRTGENVAKSIENLSKILEERVTALFPDKK